MFSTFANLDHMVGRHSNVQVHAALVMRHTLRGIVPCLRLSSSPHRRIITVQAEIPLEQGYLVLPPQGLDRTLLPKSGHRCRMVVCRPPLE